jgi:hypothetical protein
MRAGARLIELPASCHLTYDERSADPRLTALMRQVPEELWGAKLALQVTACMQDSRHRLHSARPATHSPFRLLPLHAAPSPPLHVRAARLPPPAKQHTVPSSFSGCPQLLHERLQGPDSPFAAYIANLPAGFEGVPMFFPREAIEAIDYAPVVEQVKKRCR